MKRVFIIAEAGVNHNGVLETAKRMVDAAADAGADAVKFQTWKTELLMTRRAKLAEYQADNLEAVDSQFDMARRLELSYDDFRRLKEYCDTKNILFLSTPDEERSATFLASLQSTFKIGSGELNNLPFLRHVAKLAKKIILSTGMGTLAEVERAIDAIESTGMKRRDITLLHATTQYPTPMNAVNLNAMRTMAAAFKTEVGYSDHTLGIEVPVAAVAMGAAVIEKHFTLDKSMEGPDHKASLDPAELKRMVEAIRNIEAALGDGIKRVMECELPNRPVVRKYIVASKDISRGERLDETNLCLKRAGEGIEADRWDEIVGSIALRSYKKDEPI